MTTMILKNLCRFVARATVLLVAIWMCVYLDHTLSTVKYICTPTNHYIYWLTLSYKPCFNQVSNLSYMGALTQHKNSHVA